MKPDVKAFQKGLLFCRAGRRGEDRNPGPAGREIVEYYYICVTFVGKLL